MNSDACENFEAHFSLPALQVPVCCTRETAPPPASDEIYFLCLGDPVMALTLLREKMQGARHVGEDVACVTHTYFPH